MNQGKNSVSEDHIKNVCRQMLEEAKTMYKAMSSRDSSPNDFSDTEINISDNKMNQNVINIKVTLKLCFNIASICRSIENERNLKLILKQVLIIQKGTNYGILIQWRLKSINYLQKEKDPNGIQIEF